MCMFGCFTAHHCANMCVYFVKFLMSIDLTYNEKLNGNKQAVITYQHDEQTKTGTFIHTYPSRVVQK